VVAVVLAAVTLFGPEAKGVGFGARPARSGHGEP